MSHEYRMRSLKDFGAVQEPRVEGKGGSEIQNITDRGGGVVRFRLRVGRGWWDGDGAGGAKGGRPDRQRAECRSLGSELHRPGETWVYETTFRTSQPFTVWDGALCMVMQLIPPRDQADDAVTYLPVFAVQLLSDRRAQVLLISGDPRPVAEFSFEPGQWTNLRVRAHVDPKSGSLEASVNGGDWQGVRGVPVSRGKSRGYDMKVGVYKHLDGKKVCDDWVEHKGVSRMRVDAPPPPPPAASPTKRKR